MNASTVYFMLLFLKIILFFYRWGFHYVDQAGHELLGSSDPPALASKALRLQYEPPCSAQKILLMPVVISWPSGQASTVQK